MIVRIYFLLCATAMIFSGILAIIAPDLSKKDEYYSMAFKLATLGVILLLSDALINAFVDMPLEWQKWFSMWS